MFRGARSRCPSNGRDDKVSPQEETLEILRNFLDCVSRAKLSDRRWEHICSCTAQMAKELDRHIAIPKRRRTRRNQHNGSRAIAALCAKTQTKIEQNRQLPADQRLRLLELFQEIKQEV